MFLRVSIYEYTFFPNVTVEIVKLKISSLNKAIISQKRKKTNIQISWGLGTLIPCLCVWYMFNIHVYRYACLIKNMDVYIYWKYRLRSKIINKNAVKSNPLLISFFSKRKKKLIILRSNIIHTCSYSLTN